MDRRSAEIQSHGAEYFEQIVADREEETLHLEFKTLSQDGGQLTKDDKKTIGKAIGGMANAEGGVLILGIETKTSDGVDVAVAKRSIKNLRRTTNLVRSCILDGLSPQHPGIEVFCLDEQGKQDEGFIVIDVPPSSNRPHYSNSLHQYFRRGSDRTRVLEHSEIRELMFAVREGNIEVRVSAAQGQMTRSSGLIAGLIQLSVRNIGPVPVTDPYLKVFSREWTRAPGVPNSDMRLLPSNTIGIYAHDILHIDDQFPMAVRSCQVQFKEDGGVGFVPTISKIRESKDESTFDIKLFDPFEVTFGAMNVPPKTAKFDLSKWDMFEMITNVMLDETTS